MPRLILIVPGLLAVGPALAQVAELVRIGGYASGLGSGSVEVVAYDGETRRAFAVNGATPSFDILDLSDPAAPRRLRRVTIAEGSPNSIAHHRGLVAVAVQDADPQRPGRVEFYDRDGNPLRRLTVGAMPDMVTFSPDGRYLVSADEGEPSPDYARDPEGTVSIVDLSAGLAQARVRTVGFADFNAGGPRHAELPAGLRIFGPRASVAQDLEPEYVAIDAAGRLAYVALQENNALAVIDLALGRVERILALGTKDHGLPGQGLDPSDRDGANGAGAIRIRQAPVRGMYQPDAIAVLPLADGAPAVLSVNEGDARDYPGFSEEIRVGAAAYRLDPQRFPNAAVLKQNAELGRLVVSNRAGDLDGDGDFDEIHAFGARSLSLFDGGTGALLWDSGDQLEQLTALSVPGFFNSDGTHESFDTRSDNKGPEPEALAVGMVSGRRYAFVGLERTGGFAIYDLTEPRRPRLLGYGPSTHGDRSPEVIQFVPGEESPNGRPLLLAAHEVSGTLGVYELRLCRGGPSAAAPTALCPGDRRGRAL
jgi:hypothetical protein